MKMSTSVATLAVVAVFLTVTAHAGVVEPAYNGPLGNQETVAMRPYKWAWNGVKALVYQPARSFKDGNLKKAVGGSIEITRGARRGLVEMGESVAKGIVGAQPPECKDYKKLGKANTFIDNDPLFNTALNVPILIIPQCALDKYPVNDKEAREKIENKAQETREARAKAAQKKAPNLTPVEKARREYIGERATLNHRPAFRGNIYKEFK